MATIANAYHGLASGALGLREDLTDKIYMISPTQTPFLSQICKRTDASASYHEWQTDILAAAADNAVIEGEDATIDAPAYTKRIGNNCQISDKTVITTGTLEAVSKAGRRKEMAMQLSKKSKELKRDMELVLTQNGARVVGTTSAARHIAGLENWYQTNGTSGVTFASDGGHCANTGGTPNAAAVRTEGTPRGLTEAMMRAAILACWNSGGDPSVIMCSGSQKQNISALAGAGAGRPVSTPSADKRFSQAVDVYQSDFGEHRVIPNRFQRHRSVHVLDPDLWSVAYLRGFSQWPLAKTGDSEKRQLLAEYTLEAQNESGSCIIADLT